MTWFKVDDKLHDHRKARAAGTAAMGVWVLAGSWAADNLTDGFVPAAILPRWGRPRDATRLVEVGLWHADEQDGEAGWRFHEWHERQPTRAQKLAERAAKVEAGKIGGLASGRSRRQAPTKQGASVQVEPPTRPDPTRPTAPTAAVAVRDDHEPTAQSFVAEWIEHCPNRPPGRVIGQVAKELKAMLAEGVDPSRVRSGLAEWNNRGLHPSTLPSVVHEISTPQRRRGKQQETDDIFSRAAVRMGVIQGGQQ